MIAAAGGQILQYNSEGKSTSDARAEGCEKTRGPGVKRGLWGGILILDLGEHRKDRVFQSTRKNEDRIKLVPVNGNSEMMEEWSNGGMDKK